MMKLRILGISLFLAMLLYAAWSGGYHKGSRETAERESKAWEALIASGWLDGFRNEMHHWADKVSANEVDKISADYRSNYERFTAAGAKVTEKSGAYWLVDNHARGQMKPDEFESILRKYQIRPDSSSE